MSVNHEAVERVMHRVLECFQETPDGWCTAEKAEILIDLALEPHVTRAVEIGVFAGRSFFPVAFALAEKREGFLIGIDPYRVDDQVQGFTDQPAHANWAKECPWDKFYDDVNEKIKRYNIGKHAALLRARSDAVQDFFGRADLVHIDGNHSEEVALNDVCAWWDVLRPGGFIVLDDVNWESVKGATKFLDDHASCIHRSKPDWWNVYRKD